MEHNPVQALVPPWTSISFCSKLSKELFRYIPAASAHSGKHKAQQLQVKLVHAGSRKLGKQQPDLSNRQMGNSAVAKWHHSRHARRLPAREGTQLQFGAVSMASGSHPLVAIAGSCQHLFSARQIDIRESNGNEQQG